LLLLFFVKYNRISTEARIFAPFTAYPPTIGIVLNTDQTLMKYVELMSKQTRSSHSVMIFSEGHFLVYLSQRVYTDMTVLPTPSPRCSLSFSVSLCLCLSSLSLSLHAHTHTHTHIYTHLWVISYQTEPSFPVPSFQANKKIDYHWLPYFFLVIGYKLNI
jgi:hypothetical protein